MLTSKKEKPAFPMAAVIAAVAVLVVGSAAGWYLNRPVEKQPDTPTAPEAKAYVRNLRLADVEMKATDSFVSQRLVEINGKISNTGDKALKEVAVTCIFYDPSGQLVLREKVTVVKPSGSPFQPGETREFRLPFDNIPVGWNQALPQIVIAQIIFG